MNRTNINPGGQNTAALLPSSEVSGSLTVITMTELPSLSLSLAPSRNLNLLCKLQQLSSDRLAKCKTEPKSVLKILFWSQYNERDLKGGIKLSHHCTGDEAVQTSFHSFRSCLLIQHSFKSTINICCNDESDRQSYFISKVRVSIYFRKKSSIIVLRYRWWGCCCITSRSSLSTWKIRSFLSQISINTRRENPTFSLTCKIYGYMDSWI